MKKFPVFVYGTLKKGYGLHHVLSNAEFVGYGVTESPDFCMRYSGAGHGFPFVYRCNEKESSRVSGELYLVDKETLSHLDTVEGVPTLYKREKVRVEIPKEDSLLFVDAYMYVAPHKTEKNAGPYCPKDSLGNWRWG